MAVNMVEFFKIQRLVFLPANSWIVHRASKPKKICIKLRLFSYPSVLTCVLGAQKNRLIDTCFG